MTQDRREERRKPRDRDRDRDRDSRDRGRRWSPRVETEYIFAVNGRPTTPPEVHGDRFRLGDIVSTSDGPHKVIEVYWLRENKARVLLRPAKESEKLRNPEEPEKIQRSRKFNTRGARPSHRLARNQNQNQSQNQSQR